MTQRAKPILVTGSHRSGTTWVGKLLAANSQVRYVAEPFNPSGKSADASRAFTKWFTYVSAHNEQDVRPYVELALGRDLPIKPLLQSWTDGGFSRLRRDILRYVGVRNRDLRVLIKDPIAVFSSEWMAQTFDMDVIVMVRHPAAFASSLKRLGWTFNFSDILSQEELINDHLYDFKAEILSFVNNPGDIIEQAALLWKLIYTTVDDFREKHPDWCIVRHEDLAADPVRGFERLYERMGLSYSSTVRSKVKQVCGSHNPVEHDVDERHSIRMHSARSIQNWKDRLTREEVSRLRYELNGVSGRFYDDDDW